MPRQRATIVALALACIALGLWIHRGGGALGVDAQDVTGDALWAAMICWWLGALRPDARASRRAAVALSICTAVELGQLLHTPALDTLRATLPGRLVLGSGFDTRDLLAYAIGIATATLLERIARGRHQGSVNHRARS